MFSSRAPKLIGAALMDLAEAMLRPVDADGLEHVPTERRAGGPAADRPSGPSAAGDDWLVGQLFTGELAPRSSLAPAPTRTQRAGSRTEPLLPRIERTRRPGMVERLEQPCVSPLPRRTATRGHHAA